MRRFFLLVFLAMGGAWFAAAGGLALWARWPALALACLLLPVALAMRPPTVRTAPVTLPIGLLVAYGLAIALKSRLPVLATTKAVVFGATAIACLWGGALLVEHFGRDRVLLAWRWALRLYLVFVFVGLAVGAWAWDEGGLSGPTANPNQLASNLGTLGLPLLLPFSTWRIRLPDLVEAAAAGALLLATRGRAMMAGVFLSIAVGMWLGRGRARWIAAGAVCLAGALALVAIPERSLSSAAHLLEAERGVDVFETRRRTWAESWDAMELGLPLGLGWGVKANASRDFAGEDRTVGLGREEGTSWLPLGEELGLPGFALVLWLLGAMGVASARAPVGLRSMAGGGFVLFLVLATFEAWLLAPGSWESFAFWTWAGIVLSSPRDAPGVAPPRAQGGEP